MPVVSAAPAAEGLPVERRWAVAEFPLLLVGGLVIVCVAIDVWWLYRFRARFPLDINESQYMGFALALKDSLAHSGPVAAWHTWGAETGFGPLLPLTSVPVFALLGESVTNGFVSQLVFFVLLIASSYALGRRLSSSRSAGVLLALLVAATPTVIDFTRSYEFPVTAAAILTACTYALLASEALTRRGWALLWGVLLGLLPLSRTMTMAFVPAQLIAAGWLIASRPGEHRARLINAAIALAAAAVTAGAWFVKSWHAQLSYLTNFGYGSESAHFSTAGSKLSIAYWTRELVSTVREDLYLPLAVLVAVCFIVALAALMRHRWRSDSGFRAWVRAWSSGDAAVVALVVVEGYLAVTSSRNEGVGFRVPLLPALLALAIYALWRLPWPRARKWAIVALAAVSAFNIAMKADAVGALSGRVLATVPGFGKVPVIDGTGWIQGYVLGSAEARYATATKPLPDSQRAWMPAYEAIDRDILGLARRTRATPNVELTTDEPLLNAFDLSFAAQLHFHYGLIANVLPAPLGPPTLTAYETFLRGKVLSGVNALISVSSAGSGYFTAAQAPDQGLFQRAGAAVGFFCSAVVALPDGRQAFISRRMPRGSASISAPVPGCAPRVQRTLPTAGAMGVSPNARVVVFFNEPMESNTLGRALWVARRVSGHRVAGRVVPFGELAVVFIPAAPLPPRTSFTATVASTTRGAIGARLAHLYSWTFTTR